MPIAWAKMEDTFDREQRTGSRSAFFKALNAGMVIAAFILYVFHFIHLRADFPNHSPWTDWSKYTDEGWYGDAAIRHYQSGSWYVPGDFNPAAALPVWPTLEAILFHFTGVSLIAVRALTLCVFGLTLSISSLLIRRWNQLTGVPAGRSLSGSLAVLMLAASPFCYAFTRLAILEPLLILIMLLSLLSVSYAPIEDRRGHVFLSKLSSILVLGVLLPSMVLTKTTAIFLLPAIAWLLYARCRYSVGCFLAQAVPAGAVGAALWSLYFFVLIRPHYLADYRYLFSANGYTGITVSTVIPVLSDTISDGMWIGTILYPVSLFCALASLLGFARLKRNPLVPALLMWAAGYLCFLAYHDNLQPRYYMVIAVPLTLLVAVVLDGLWIVPMVEGRKSQMMFDPICSAVSIAILVLMIGGDARKTWEYVQSPEYTFLTAAEKIHRIVSSDPRQSALLLSISGSDISLMTGVRSICDDFGTMELEDRVRTYRPGWYAAWNQVDDDKMDALAPLYHLERVAAFPAMDDPERNQLILYRLDPADTVSTRRPRHRFIPRRLRTVVGQQPSVEQLQH